MGGWTIEKKRASNRRYYARNREKILERNRRTYAADPEKAREMRRRYKRNNRLKIREKSRQRHAARRVRAIAAYGGECVCCGETELAFLTFDHIDGRGTKERQQLKGREFLRHLEKNNYPPGIQILCANCHLAKTNNPGGCPHQKQTIFQWNKLKAIGGE